MNYFEFHLGDYEKSTAHLSACEDGIYGRLLRRYYDTELPLPADVKAIQRLVRARTREEKNAVATVLTEFFYLAAEGYRNARCDEEIARFQDKRKKAVNSANARWKGKNSQVESDTNAYETHALEECGRNAFASAAHVDRNAHQSPDSNHQSPVSTSQDRGDGDDGTSNSARVAVVTWQPTDEIYLEFEEQGIPVEFSMSVWLEFREYWSGKCWWLPTEWRSRFVQRVCDQWDRRNKIRRVQ